MLGGCPDLTRNSCADGQPASAKFAGTRALCGGRGEPGSRRLSAPRESPSSAAGSRRHGAPAPPHGDGPQALEGFLKAAAYANVILRAPGSRFPRPGSQRPRVWEARTGSARHARRGSPALAI